MEKFRFFISSSYYRSSSGVNTWPTLVCPKQLYLACFHAPFWFPEDIKHSNNSLRQTDLIFIQAQNVPKLDYKHLLQLTVSVKFHHYFQKNNTAYPDYIIFSDPHTTASYFQTCWSFLFSHDSIISFVLTTVKFKI